MLTLCSHRITSNVRSSLVNESLMNNVSPQCVGTIRNSNQILLESPLYLALGGNAKQQEGILYFMQLVKTFYGIVGDLRAKCVSSIVL